MQIQLRTVLYQSNRLHPHMVAVQKYVQRQDAVIHLLPAVHWRKQQLQLGNEVHIGFTDSYDFTLLATQMLKPSALQTFFSKLSSSEVVT